MFQRVAMIVMLLIIVLGGGFYAYNQLMPNDVEEAQGPIYSTKEVIKGDISVGVEVKGSLDSSRGSGIRVPGERRYDGGSTQFAINEVLVEEGDSVKKGDIIARLDSTEIETKVEEKEDLLDQKLEQLADMTGVDASEVERINPLKGITLRAPIKGSIVDLDVKEGQELELGHVIGRIVDSSIFKAKIKLTPIEFGQVNVGQKVVLAFDEFDGFYDAEITKINSNAVPNTSENDKDKDDFAKGFVHIAEIEGTNPGLIQSGMKVRVGIKSKYDSNVVKYFGHLADIDGFVKEKKVLNTIKSVVTEVHVDNMEDVKEGDEIVTMASKDIQDTIEEKLEEIRELRSDINDLRNKLDQLEITTSVDGIIAYFEMEVGDTVRSGQWIGSIFNVESMQMWAKIDDIDVINVKIDAPVRVTVDAIPGEVFEGTIAQIDMSGDRENSGITKYDVYIDVKGNSQLKPGMQAKGFVDAGSAKDVLLVPLEGIFQEEGRYMVEVLDESGSPKVIPVKLGLMNDKIAEVKEGLKEGDMVITGSSADLLPSQHIGSKDSILPNVNDKKDESKNESEEN
ncbi:efflux RND transporter periplasmic adaptor subunit [Wukongibacter sp. M2B1]|uniref:efflux RND transporter periplasmic adaptor subunit n=1 Tax=Wukongibacter sp. M2B1 TaxID=3088895 RepID=UPI003D7AB6C2